MHAAALLHDAAVVHLDLGQGNQLQAEEAMEEEEKDGDHRAARHDRSIDLATS
jgi:hypothetical protein